MASLSLSIVEIIVLMAGAIVLGITIHFFITSRKNLKASLSTERNKTRPNLDEWKLKYLNDMEVKDKELALLKHRLNEHEENVSILTIEADEAKRDKKKLQAELEAARKAIPAQPQGEKTGYFEQLRQAQQSLLEHNVKINLLLENIDAIKETEEKQQEILKDNEELYGQIADLQSLISQKDQEIQSIRQKASLSREMTSMLDNAYNEFSILQSKIQKLESQVTTSKKLNIEYEDLKEQHLKTSRDLEELKMRSNALSGENRELQLLLRETEDKLKEANFQRQQLQKRVSYLEELNNDLQVVSEANKKLEGQIKRIGELESMLNVIAEERDQLIRKQI